MRAKLAITVALVAPLMACATVPTDYEVCEGETCADPVDIEVE